MSSKKSVAKEAIIAYVPAVHAGYLSFFKRNKTTDLFLLGSSLISITPRMERDIRAISAAEALRILRALRIFKSVSILEKKNIAENLKVYKKFILPNEDISRDFAARFLKGKRISFEEIFLRWDKKISTTEFIIPPDRTISTKSTDLRLLKEAAREAVKSPDWWRKIGAVLVKGKKIKLRSYNRHFPHNLVTDIMGDPRSNFDYGEYPEIYLSIHAEADIVAQAAHKGIPLKGSEIYVTTFPCANCARLLVRAGVKRIFYAKGYSSFDAEKILRSSGVEIILVEG